MSLIVVNVSEIFMGGCKKKKIKKLKSSLVCGFKKSVWSKISLMDVGVEKLLLVKCSQTLIIWINKSSLLCFGRVLCLVGVCFLSEKG